MIKQVNIYDFDGTLVDSSHRYRGMICADGVERIDLDHWIENEHLAINDSLLPLMEQFRKDTENPEVFVIIATARVWCEVTQEFADIHGIEPDLLVARTNRADCRGGAELKIEGIAPLLSQEKFSNAEVHVFEDNDSYLDKLCKAFSAIGHFIPSNQGL